MTSKERVKITFDFKEPDKTPKNYLANPGIDYRLKKHFNLDVSNTEGLLKALEIDFREIHLPYIGPRLHPEIDGRNIDPCFGIRTRLVEHKFGEYWDYCDFPLANADLSTAQKWEMPNPDDFDYSFIKKQCQTHSKYYITYTNQPDIINSTGMIMGMENVLLTLLTDNPIGLTYIDRRLELQLEQVKRVFKAAKGQIDCLWIGEDLGTQHSPLISLDIFRKHIRPRHQKFIDIAKKYNAKVMMHSCGSSSWAYEDFIDMGIDIVDTIQQETTNMSPKYLKEHFGKRLAFHGCVSTGDILTEQTPKQIKAHCRQIMEVFGPDYGYVLAPTHMFSNKTPTENVLAMYNII